MTSPAPRSSRQSLRSVLRSGLFRSGLGVAGMRVAGLGLSLILSVFLARVMGVEGLGLYTLAFAAISLLGLPVQMGMPALVVRETARANAVEDWPLMRGLWLWATRRILILSALIMMLAGAVVMLAPDVISARARPVFLIGLPLVPLIALSSARGAALQGLGRVVPSQFADAILRPGVLILTGGAIYLAAQQPLDPKAMMALHLLAAFLSFVVGVFILMRVRPAGVKTETTHTMQVKSWQSTIWTLALIASAQSIMANADYLMLGWWRAAAEVGQYRVATAGANLTAVGLGIVAAVINPRFAALHRNNEPGALAKLAAQGAGVSLLLALPVALVFLVWSGPILTLVFGPAYTPGAGALMLLTGAQTLNAFFGSSVGLLNMTGHEKQAMKGFLTSTAVNVVLNAALIPYWGIEGAALATLVSMLVWNLMLWRSARRILGIDCSVLGLLRGPTG